LCLLNGHIDPPLMILSIEFRIINIIFWACSPVSFKHTTSWYMLLEPDLPSYHSNVGVWLRPVVEFGTSTLCTWLMYCGIKIICGHTNVRILQNQCVEFYSKSLILIYIYDCNLSWIYCNAISTNHVQFLMELMSFVIIMKYNL
jgi:hypothetical protein